MNDISNLVIDIYDDIEFSGMKKIASQSIPKDVKKMDMMTPSQLDQLSDNDFGLVTFDKYANKIRRYPINDSANTWLSAQYFDKTASVLPGNIRDSAASRILIACSRFGIEDYPKSLERGFTKTANKHDYQNYALRGQYPIHTEKHVKLAAGWFCKYASQMDDPRDRNTFATNVLNRAKELKTEIQKEHRDALQKYASSSFNPCLNLHLTQRANIVGNNEKMKNFLEKLGEYRKTETPQQIADCLYRFDKQAGLSKYWDKKIRDPYSSVMGIEKEASVTLNVGNNDMTDEDLSKVLNSDKLKQYFDDNLIKAAQKNPVAIFESLPDAHKEIIYNIHKGIL